MEFDVTAAQAQKAVSDGTALILDVRHKEEVDFTAIPEKFTWIEFQELSQRFGELPRGKPIFCLCRTGGRSGGAAEFLREKGFDARNISGGIFAWSKIEPKVKKYVYFFEGEKTIVAGI